MKEKIADKILIGATIFCGKGLPKDHDFVAIKGNKIIGIGRLGEEEEYISPHHTTMISLEKTHLVMPGLHDNHIHLIQAGMFDKYVDLTNASSQEEAANMVAKFAKTIPNEAWIIGFGWSRMSWDDKEFPKKQTLDHLIPERPVFLLDSELHGAWVNSKAFEISGIDRNTKNPEFGTIAKDEDGAPAGYLYETALCLVGKYAFQFSGDIVEDLIRRYMRMAVKWGITSVSDMTPYLGINLAYEDTFYKMDRQGDLKIRINAARNLFEKIEDTLEVRREAEASGTGMYRVPYVKQFLDGVVANYTALLLDDYSTKPGEKGEVLLDLSELDKAIVAAHNNSLSVRLHACGDGAVRIALDAFEKARKQNSGVKVRHQIEHIECIHPHDLKRFQELGVIASVQPEHIISGIPTFLDNCYPAFLGERDQFTWAFKSLLKNGAVLACGSDAPVVPGDPFYGMYVGMTRIHPDGNPRNGWNAKEKLDAEELIHGYTYGAAFAEMREQELGTLELGKLADITVVDRNLLNISSEEVKNTKVLFTIVNGEVVYEK